MLVRSGHEAGQGGVFGPKYIHREDKDRHIIESEWIKKLDKKLNKRWSTWFKMIRVSDEGTSPEQNKQKENNKNRNPDGAVITALLHVSN